VRMLAEKRGLTCEEIVAEGTGHRSMIRASDEIGAHHIVFWARRA
jgi:hypothetical protein